MIFQTVDSGFNLVVGVCGERFAVHCGCLGWFGVLLRVLFLRVVFVELLRTLAEATSCSRALSVACLPNAPLFEDNLFDVFIVNGCRRPSGVFGFGGTCRGRVRYVAHATLPTRVAPVALGLAGKALTVNAHALDLDYTVVLFVFVSCVLGTAHSSDFFDHFDAQLHFFKLTGAGLGQGLGGPAHQLLSKILRVLLAHLVHRVHLFDCLHKRVVDR